MTEWSRQAEATQSSGRHTVHAGGLSFRQYVSTPGHTYYD